MDDNLIVTFWLQKNFLFQITTIHRIYLNNYTEDTLWEYETIRQTFRI